MSTTTLQRAFGGLVIIAAMVTGISCGEVVRSSRAPVLVVVESIEAASGANPDEFFAFLLSDVVTLVPQTINGQEVRVPTIFNDFGRGSFRITPKNPGSATTPLSASDLNSVTLTRYRVVFRRADGRNTPGVDVPHGFDSALTGTISPGASSTIGFELVRHQNKAEPPLRNLQGFGSAGFISTLAEITFFGRDQVGNEVSVQAFITVNFSDFGDPE